MWKTPTCLLRLHLLHWVEKYSSSPNEGFHRVAFPRSAFFSLKFRILHWKADIICKHRVTSLFLILYHSKTYPKKNFDPKFLSKPTLPSMPMYVKLYFCNPKIKNHNRKCFVSIRLLRNTYYSTVGRPRLAAYGLWTLSATDMGWHWLRGKCTPFVCSNASRWQIGFPRGGLFHLF